MVTAPVGQRGSLPKQFSRSMDWAELGNGAKIRVIPVAPLARTAPTGPAAPADRVEPAALVAPAAKIAPAFPAFSAVPALSALPDQISPMLLTPDRESVFGSIQPLYQLAASAPAVPASNPSPITGAQSQPPAAPADVAPIGQEYTLGGALKLPEGMNLSIRQLDFRETDLKDALRSLATLANLNLMLNAQVAGTVTILFSDVTIEEAFNTLLKSYDLAFTWQGSILSIFPLANAPLITTIFNIQNTNAAQVKDIVDKVLTPTRGRSEVDARTNALMVTDTQHVLDQIRKLLPQIDVKEAAVEVMSRPVTEVFYLDYVDATVLTQPIQMVAPAAKIQAYSSSQASMAAAGGGAGGGGRMDMMIITDTQSNLDRIRELVEKLDVAPIQVTIDANIYEINLNEEERLGINWQKSIPVPGAAAGVNAFDMTIAPEDANAGGTGVFRWGSLDVNQFRALLAMLKTHSFAKVLSNPVITTLNNRQANITVGQAIPYVSASSINAQTGQVSNTVSQANANITLLVTPSVTGNDEVFLNISPTISSVLGFTTLGGNATPNLSNRSAQTQVIIRNNHTIVIGGMIKTDKSDNISKVPFFGDLPGIGHLFRKKTTSETRTELIIFITPHILRQHGTNPQQTANSQESLQPRISLQP